jgi:hypothetical protein
MSVNRSVTYVGELDHHREHRGNLKPSSSVTLAISVAKKMFTSCGQEIDML